MLNTPNVRSFKDYICLKEGKEHIEPHIVSTEIPFKLSKGIERIVTAFKNSKEIPIGKEVDSKVGGEKDVTMKSKKLFIVGGAVRDYLLGHTPKNYNFATDAHPEEAERILKHAKIDAKKTEDGVKVNVDGETYTIETMKVPNSEGGSSFTTDPQQDSNRRDLTVNSLYYEPSSKKIYDYTGGLRHIKDGTVKFIGKAEDKIKENGLTKYRYARMLNKVPNAKVDDEVKNAISSIDTELPPDQIRDEFWKGLEDLHANPAKYLKTYEDLGLLSTVFPKLELTMDFPECKTCKSRPIVLASLLKKNKPQKLVEELKKLKYSDREIKDAVYLINLLLFKPEYIYDFKREMMNTSLTKRQIMDWAKINDLDEELIEKMLNHKISSNPSEVMSSQNVQGKDLLNAIRNIEYQSFMKV